MGRFPGELGSPGRREETGVGKRLVFSGRMSNAQRIELTDDVYSALPVPGLCAQRFTRTVFVRSSWQPSEFGVIVVSCPIDGKAEAPTESLSRGHNLSVQKWKCKRGQFHPGVLFFTHTLYFPASSLHPCGSSIRTGCHVTSPCLPIEYGNLLPPLPTIRCWARPCDLADGMLVDVIQAEALYVLE